MANHRYKVLRHLIGDKTYEPGDERIAEPGSVAHLVPRALEDLGPVKEAKAEDAPKNKAEPAAPSNKAAKPAGKGAKKDKA
ncbi:MAG TPA: hypothetical protein VMF90_12360 [Rhizobiaceae bacterium]|nr:hypothetical protein [Rhizobiaceae bacterium]